MKIRLFYAVDPHTNEWGWDGWSGIGMFNDKYSWTWAEIAALIKKGYHERKATGERITW